MRRWVLGLAVLGAGFWAWQTWYGDPPAPVEAMSQLTPDAGSETGTPAAALSVSPPSAAASTAEKTHDAPRLKALCEAVARREPAALGMGYRQLLDAAASEREDLVAALQQAGGDGLDTLVAVLGDGNAFIHTDAGRAAGRRAAKAAAAEKGEAGLAALTAILERAMRGAIEKEDTAARAFVDEVYALMQAPLNRTVFNPEFTAGARTHKVARGESLDRIAALYRRQGILLDAMTIGLFNRISDPTKLFAGQVLKLPVQPVCTVLEKRSYLLAVYLGDVIFRLYWVGHGKDDRTPETTFTVGLKQERPDWYIDGRVIPFGHPDNILGAYFVKFEHPSFQGYGAHGTPEPETIGTMASRGCVRMRDADIRDFFQIVPRGTEVHVRSTAASGSR